MNKTINHREIAYFPKNSTRLHKAVLIYPHYKKLKYGKYWIPGRLEIFDSRNKRILYRKNLTTHELRAIEDNIKAVGTIVYTTEMK